MYAKSKVLALTLAIAMMSLAVHAGPFSSDQPQAPSGLKAVTKSSSAILLSWEKAHSPPSLPIQAYAIQYAPTQGGQENVIAADNTTSHLFDRLQPNTSYTFYVRAYNSKGASDLSEPVVQMTGVDGDKPQAPSGLKAVTKSSTAILLSWEQVHSPPSLPILGYVIHYEPTQGGYKEYDIAEYNTTSHLIDRLKPNTSYTFYVKAYNSKGAGEPSKPVVQMTAEDAGSLRLGLGFSALSPPLVIVPRNHPVLLNCSGYSEEGPLRLSWRLENRDLTLLSNGSLRIDRLLPRQKRERRFDGTYTCVLRNNVGTLLSTPIHVVMARMSKRFTLQPQSQTAINGGQALFRCEMKAAPPCTITWYKNGVELPRNDAKYTSLPSGSLQITGVTKRDSGRYKCQCSNIAGVKNSSRALLSVLPRTEPISPPVFLHLRHVVFAAAGTPAVLECFADGFPKVEYSWSREDGKNITEKHLLGNSNLFFPKVQLTHAGVYVCSAKVTSSDKAEVILIVYGPPTFTEVPMSQTVPAAGTVRFHCEVESYLPSTIYWVKDGERLDIRGRINLRRNNRTLVVSHTVTSDSGIYQCVASNLAGVNTSDARLLVTVSSDQPQAPSGLKAVTKSSSAILLSWEQVHSPPSLPIVAYSVHYEPTQGGQENSFPVGNTTSRYLFGCLQPNTSYTFYVRAYNRKGASESSEPVVQMTGADGRVHEMRKCKNARMPVMYNFL